MGGIDPFHMTPAVGPGADFEDGFWQLQELRSFLADPFALSLLRGRLVELLGSCCVIRMSDEEILAEIPVLIRAGLLKPGRTEEPRVASGATPAEEAPPPPAARPKPPAAPESAPPPTAATPPGPAATARMEAAQSGVPFWECCEKCGF
jgi:hypothetical protein